MEKPVTWNLGKNSKLKMERGISFEEILEKLERNAYKVIANPSRNHPRQKVFVVSIRGRTFAVPHTEYASHIFLRTIYEV